MRKSYYESPVVEIVYLSKSDIITDSLEENVDIDGWT